MKILYTALLIILTGYKLSAQHHVAAIPVSFDEETLKAGNYGMFCLENSSDHSFSCVLKNGGNISYVLFDPSYKIVKQVNNKVTAKSFLAKKGSKIYTGFVNGDSHNYILQGPGNPDGSQFILQVMDFKSGTPVEKDLFTVSGRETEVAGYVLNNTFYYVSALQNSDSLLLRIVASDGGVSMNTFKLPLPSILQGMKIDMAYVLRSAAVMVPETENNFLSTTKFAKIYPEQHRIRIVANYFQSRTYVVTIDLVEKKAKTQEFYPYKTVIEYNDESPVIKSVVCDDKLFTLSLYKDKADISIHDLVTEKLLNLVALPSDFNSFAATPVSFSRDRSKESKSKPKSFGKEFKNTHTFSAITVDNNKKGFYEIGIGVHEAKATAKMWTDKTVVKVPGYTFVSWGPTYHSLPEFRASHFDQAIFTIMLDASTFRIASGQSAKEPQPERFFKLLHALPENSFASNPFLLNGRPALGYYKKKSNEFVIEMLD
jgi:hypothetical protein